jgi:hypothetical protein
MAGKKVTEMLNDADEFGSRQMNGVNDNTYPIGTDQTSTLLFSTLEMLRVQDDILRKNNKKTNKDLAFLLKNQVRFLPTSEGNELTNYIYQRTGGRKVYSLYKLQNDASYDQELMTLILEFLKGEEE